MRKISKKGAGEEGYNMVYVALAILILVIGGYALYKYVLVPMEKSNTVTVDALGTVSQACMTACAANDKTTFCGRQYSVNGMTTDQETKLIAIGINPTGNICAGTSAKICSDLKAKPTNDTAIAAYNTAKGNNAQTFDKVTCNQMNQAGLVDACQQFTC
jgi:hypothetical protein